MGVGRCPALFSLPEAGITGIGVSSVPPAHGGWHLVCISGARGNFDLIRCFDNSQHRFFWGGELSKHPSGHAAGITASPSQGKALGSVPHSPLRPKAGTSGIARASGHAAGITASPMQGTQAFLRKARWWVSEANPDEVEHRGSSEVYHTNGIRRGSPHKRHPPRCAAATQNIGYPPSLPAGAATPCHLNSPPRSACLSVCASLYPPKNHKKGTEKTFRPLVVQLASFSAVVSASFAGAECPPFALRGRRLRR